LITLFLSLFRSFSVAQVNNIDWNALNLDPDIGLDMEQIVMSKGYPIESYNVTTKDGYILGVFRIPYGRNQSNQKILNKPAVFLQHGLLDSSWTFVANFPNESLGFILADAGYDVWFGNSRGNYYSLGHSYFDVDTEEYWNFTWDDMAKYDLPAQIDFALSENGAMNLTYIGHSQGTIQGFAGFSINTTLSSQVNLFIALAPVAYAYHASGLLKIFAEIDLDTFFLIFGNHDFLPDASLLQKLAPDLCGDIDWICSDILGWVAGKTNHLNKTRLQVYVSETPAGTSVKNIAHWGQCVRSNTFQMYDYGCGILTCENMKIYGQRTPPRYNLSLLQLPISLFYGGDDTLADPTDVLQLIRDIPKKWLYNAKFTKTYAHLDYTWGVDANKNVYYDVVKQISKFNPIF